jgi:hypothetical protein
VEKKRRQSLKPTRGYYFDTGQTMKRGSLITEELRHLEHRLGVLRSFLDVASDAAFYAASGATREGRIFRGCKDGAIATCRALAERFGISLNSESWVNLEPCTLKFKAAVTRAYPSALEPASEALWEVLIAANRAVCHLEDKLIDHRVDSAILRDAIELMQNLVSHQLCEAKLKI